MALKPKDEVELETAQEDELEVWQEEADDSDNAEPIFDDVEEYDDEPDDQDDEADMIEIPIVVKVSRAKLAIAAKLWRGLTAEQILGKSCVLGLGHFVEEEGLQEREYVIYANIPKRRNRDDLAAPSLKPKGGKP